MKYLRVLAVLAFLVIVQTTLLPRLFPWLPLAPAFLYLVVLSFRLPRNFLLTAGLWSGLVQDILVGEVFGLTMFTNYIAMAVVWEFKDDLLDNAVVTCGVRVVIATLVQEFLTAFVYYIYSAGSGHISNTLQISAGLNLLSNLLLYALFMLWLRLRGSEKVSAFLEARS
ncbi:MAG: rod shape-determining protein MreD [Firmicutes bacterium]|nr:rod shape-determining protein MreD [Bacillota bacterium]HOB35082.1 rod shape-determining protein MreD [Bacillota bacterium]HPZ90584.1 rod shape-determining protein MreD [Bacillota bacterium]HQE02202.1 rod shape-determining protein MreD [Bacillota bacterium]